MIRCLPKGVCSWDFILEKDGIWAEVNFARLKEKGTIEMGEHVFEIHKNGPLSGEWTLLQDGQEVASANKVSVFKRTFEVRKGLDEWQLRAESVLGRSFLIIRSNQAIGRIAPMHGLTRRSTIEMYVTEYDTEIVAFSFWLVILMWRRAASRS